MSEKKRKSKRPKSMRVTTEASKAKLPAPTRKRKAKPCETWAEGYAKWEAKAERAKRVQCPRCEKLVPSPPNDIHTCYDAKALREARAIPCGEDVVTTTGTTGTNAIYQRINVIGLSFDGEDGRTYTIQEHGVGVRWTPPDTSAYPWGLKFAWWLDGVPTRVRRWLAVRLRWLAGRIAP